MHSVGLSSDGPRFRPVLRLQACLHQYQLLKAAVNISVLGILSIISLLLQQSFVISL